MCMYSSRQADGGEPMGKHLEGKDLAAAGLLYSTTVSILLQLSLTLLKRRLQLPTRLHRMFQKSRTCFSKASCCMFGDPVCVCCLFMSICLQGRGIVMVGGGLRYMMSAWVSVHLIRQTGCRLPIEMWWVQLCYCTQTASCNVVGPPGSCL